MPQLMSAPTYSLPSWTETDMQVTTHENLVNPGTDVFTNVSTDNNEFGDIGQFINTGISRVEKNASRLLSTASLQISPNEVVAQRPWYDVWGKAKDSLSAAGSALSSTLTKVIILIVIVAVIALFGMSYVQAKAGQLAK